MCGRYRTPLALEAANTVIPVSMIRLHDQLPSGFHSRAPLALNATSRAMQGSLILQIAADVRALIAAGQPVCNLTVGDFNPKYFPIPADLLDAIVGAYQIGRAHV